MIIKYLDFQYYMICSRQISEKIEKNDAKYAASINVFITIYFIVIAWVGLFNHHIFEIHGLIAKFVFPLWTDSEKPVELFIVGLPVAIALTFYGFYRRADQILSTYQSVKRPKELKFHLLFLFQTLVIGFLGAYGEVNSLIAVIGQLSFLFVFEAGFRMYMRGHRQT